MNWSLVAVLILFLLHGPCFHIELSQSFELLFLVLHEVKTKLFAQSDLINIVVQGTLCYLDLLRGLLGSVTYETTIRILHALYQFLPELHSGDGFADGRIVKSVQLERFRFFL